VTAVAEPARGAGGRGRRTLLALAWIATARSGVPGRHRNVLVGARPPPRDSGGLLAGCLPTAVPAAAVALLTLVLTPASRRPRRLPRDVGGPGRCFWPASAHAGRAAAGALGPSLAAVVTAIAAGFPVALVPLTAAAIVAVLAWQRTWPDPARWSPSWRCSPPGTGATGSWRLAPTNRRRRAEVKGNPGCCFRCCSPPWPGGGGLLRHGALRPARAWGGPSIGAVAVAPAPASGPSCLAARSFPRASAPERRSVVQTTPRGSTPC
jgi:hypothetical protein